LQLAGLAVASAAEDFYKPCSCLVIAGPGNNGGDGLVAARHLHFFGFKTSVFYPRRKNVDIYNRLVKQCQDLNIPFLDALPEKLGQFDVLVDAVFGYSFSGDIRFSLSLFVLCLFDCRANRAPFDEIVRLLALHPHVLSIGWCFFFVVAFDMF
jgi:hydroxyethylthiazole kinase-like uncharacterized protein yjeF